jgi:hypothetical protein
MMWTPKLLGQYWHHPIFTPGGLMFFWSNLTATIWRGEVLWHRANLAAGPIDIFYLVSSTGFFLTFIIASLIAGGTARAEIRTAAMFCLPLFALCVAVLILFSISFDFGIGTFYYPSRQFPYFTQGRLILGALVPFLIMYLGGLEALLRWLRLSFARFPVLIILVDLMAISEIAYSMDVFASQYNWFHLP